MNADDVRMVAAVPPERRLREGIPSAQLRLDRVRAAQLAEPVAEALEASNGFSHSPLGPGWSTDLDLYCSHWPDERPLRDAGWLPLDGLLRRLGHQGRGRWAITDAGRVLTGFDLHLGRPAEPAEQIARRCRRLGAVRLREILELRELLRRGQLNSCPRLILRAAAAREAMLGGDLLEPWLVRHDLGASRAAAATVRGGAIRRLRRSVGAWRRRFRPRMVITLGGVDGSGKSTLADRVVADLIRAGVPATRIWCRPGMGTIESIARLIRSVLGDDSEAGVQQVARGERDLPRSRTGLLGWLWALLVTLSYLWDVWKAHLGSTGVIVYDRHRLDALVTLQFIYSRLPDSPHHRLVCRLLPEPDLEFFLDANADLALSRKRDPLFGPHAIKEQLRLYSDLLAQTESVRLLDAELTVDELAGRILDDLLHHAARA